MDKYTQPDFSSMALLTIDLQRDVLAGGPCDIPGTTAVLPKVKSLCAAFRKSGLPIFHIVRLYKDDGSNVDLCRRSMVESGAVIFRPRTSGCELAEGILPDPVRLDTEHLLSGGIQHVGPMEMIIYKPRWGAFFNTPLERHLRSLRVSSVAFAGCNFPNCPRTSIYQASERDFKIAVAIDAISGLYQRGKEELCRIGVQVMKTQELEGSLKAIF